MALEVTNFARFYALFNKLPYGGDREELKRNIVSNYTWGRTESLREMTSDEYEACCRGLEQMTGEEEARKRNREELKRRRSVCLKLMQELGIDTTDWARINNFCRHPRIAGMDFAKLTAEELEALSVKLRSIKRKGGLKPNASTGAKPSAVHTTEYVLINLLSAQGEA